MNVQSVGSAAPPPALTATVKPEAGVQGVARTAATGHATSETRKVHHDAVNQADKVNQAKKPEPPPPPPTPPLKPISATEMKIILGQLPASAGRAEVKQALTGKEDGAKFDAYA